MTIDRTIVSGTPVFRQTRVPVKGLLSNLEDGMSLDDFLDHFTSVTRQQAIQVLECFSLVLEQLTDGDVRE